MAGSDVQPWWLAMVFGRSGWQRCSAVVAGESWSAVVAGSVQSWRLGVTFSRGSVQFSSVYFRVNEIHKQKTE